jgi:hypothetical protein
MSTMKVRTYPIVPRANERIPSSRRPRLLWPLLGLLGVLSLGGFIGGLSFVRDRTGAELGANLTWLQKRTAGHPPRLRPAPRWGIATAALFNPTLRAVREQLYQSEGPWVVDSSKFEAGLRLACHASPGGDPGNGCVVPGPYPGMMA